MWPDYSAGLSDVFFSNDKREIFIVQLEVSLVITEIICFSGFRPIDIGEVIEVQSLVNQFGFVNTSPAFGIKLAENGPVFTNGVIHPSHEGIQLSIKAIEVRGTAIIGAILLIPPAVNLLVADFAKSFFG